MEKPILTLLVFLIPSIFYWVDIGQVENSNTVTLNGAVTLTYIKGQETN